MFVENLAVVFAVFLDVREDQRDHRRSVALARRLQHVPAARVLRQDVRAAVEQEPQQARPPAPRGDVRRGLAVAVRRADHAQLFEPRADGRRVRFFF